MLADWSREIRVALRSLLRSPGYAAAAAGTLALGIGATTAIFSALERVVLEPLPYPEPNRLVRISNPVPGVGSDTEWALSTAQYFFYGREAESLEALGLYRLTGVNVQGPEGPVRAQGALVSAATLRLLGGRALHGRVIGEGDDTPDAPSTVVLSHGFWQRRFGGDPEVVGRTVEVNETSREVMGVLAPGVEVPLPSDAPVGREPDLWMPYPLDPAGPFYNSHVNPAIARLAPGARLDRARAELDRLQARLPEAFPQVYPQEFFDRYGFHTTVMPLDEYVAGDVADSLWMLLGAVGLVLLIACANVANLFLVRVEHRRREIAIRSALGAGRREIARHFLSESLVLSLAGGALALLPAFWGVRWVASLAPTNLSRLESFGLDGTVLLFTLGVTLLVALALAAYPTFRGVAGSAGPLGDRGTSAGEEGGRSRFRSGLVATQVALALVLVVGAGLLLASFQRLRSADPGIEPEGVLTAEVYLPQSRYQDLSRAWDFFDRALERVRAIPGVTTAGASAVIPFSGGYGCTVQGFEDREVYERLGDESSTTCAGQAPTTPGYFEALGVPVVRGRALEPADNERPERGAVVVSEAFAERFWPGEDPIGKGVGPGGADEPPFYHVAGVVGDVYAGSVDEPPAVAIYYPIAAIPDQRRWYVSGMDLVVRTNRPDPSALLPAVRRAVQEADPAIPVANAREMTEVVDASMGRLSFTLVLMGVAAGVALLLAAVGLYGVLSYVVARRTGEIGVRLALGAAPKQVEEMVVRDSLGVVALGLGAGLLGAFLASRLLRSLLYGVAPTHLLTYLAAAGILALVALAASWLPARRAARIDPAEALRVE